MKKAMLLTTFFFTSYVFVPLWSQKNDTTWMDAKYKFYFTPSSLANYYSGLQFAQEFKISKYFRFHVEHGVVLYHSLYRQTLGYRIRPEVRLRFTSKKNNSFVDFGFLYNYRKTTSRVEREVYINSVLQNQEAIRTVTTSSFGLGLYYGFYESMPMQIGTALGIGTLKNDYNNDYVANAIKDDFLLLTINEEGTFRYLLLIVTFKISLL
jgi:hypothetical protein